MLGPAAAGAVPELTRVIHARNPSSRDRAIQALRCLKQAGFAPLLELMKEKQSAGDFVIANRCAGTSLTMELDDDQIAAAMPGLLLDAGWRGDYKAGREGAYALWPLALSPAFIPGLTNCLASPNPPVRQMALVHLVKFSREEFAIEAVRKALWDTDGSVRTEATNALLQIAPEVLTNGAAR